LKPTRLPPGQYEVDELPVLHAGGVPHISKEIWSLEVDGKVKNHVKYKFEDLLKLPKTNIEVDIHCVTSWSMFRVKWGGVSFIDMFKIVKPTPKARFVIFGCEEGWTTSLPLKDLEDKDALIAYELEAEDLDILHGGPVRTVVPKKYFYKSAKWLKKMKFTEYDELGFWETRGYSNTADPWIEDRYA
jgi:DMSO/TMAO reductase YedYZ molybdopterin-dependent catalytic subunit